MDITDTIDLKIASAKVTWATASADLDSLDGLFRKIHGYHGLGAGVDYAEVFERPLLKKDTVQYLSP